MAEYDNNLSGVLFKNDKDGNEKRPDYKGSAEIEGVEYWMSAWIREGAKGKFMSIKFEPKEKKAEAKHSAKTVKKSAPMDFDDDVPF